ncbi:MAG: hypothetical protein C0594_05155 [Marinilabiliales bacterium]|nr:MAG: hypothetical protein C0594_05155 [Marinilabiliales bacterium]
MKKTIGALLVIMFFIILYKPDKWIKKQAGLTKAKPTILQIIIFFFIGLYGGFIQAGVGFFLLAALVLSVGLDLVKANAVKLLIILFFNLVAITIFLISGIVNLKVGFVLAIGNMLGALVGTQIAVSWGPKFVRIILLTTLVISAIKLLGIYDYLAPILNLPA